MQFKQRVVKNLGSLGTIKLKFTKAAKGKGILGPKFKARSIEKAILGQTFIVFQWEVGPRLPQTFCLPPGVLPTGGITPITLSVSCSQTYQLCPSPVLSA